MERFSRRLLAMIRAARRALREAGQDACRWADVFQERARQELFEACVALAGCFASGDEHLELVVVTEVVLEPVLEPEPAAVGRRRGPPRLPGKTVDDLPPHDAWSSEGGTMLLGIGPASRLWIEPGSGNGRPLN